MPRLLLAALLLATPLASAEEPTGTASGFAELRITGSVGVEGKAFQAVERFRPTFEADLAERWVLATTIEAHLAQGRDTEEELVRVIQNSELGDLVPDGTFPENNNERLDIDDAGDVFRVDRLYLDHYGEKVDVRIGRQALQWGSAYAVNPTDPFPQVLVTEPWAPRAGINAGRITVPFGGVHKVQAVLATDDLFTELRGAGRLTFNALQTDWSVVGWGRHTNLLSEDGVYDGLVGVDLRGTLGVGWWLEGGLRLAEEKYGLLAVGVDYSFPVFQSFIVVGQYIYNGAGEPDPDNYDPLARFQMVMDPDAASALDPAAPFFLGQHYAMLVVNAGLTQDLSFTLASFQNLEDGSGFAVPTVGVRPNGWWEVSLSAQLPYRLAGPGEFSPADEDLVLSVEPLPGVGPYTADFSGIYPDATFILWTRASF
ncbi:MAG: hypothetical protein EP330_02965 [Deltaproteobacteria bacterium]|nr:MAG: hypothetical protein EP330_02965 [Deltaproteobacteria bacterium]